MGKITKEFKYSGYLAFISTKLFLHKGEKLAKDPPIIKGSCPWMLLFIGALFSIF